jgi:ABC-type sugar transport system ATPase subunit
VNRAATPGNLETVLEVQSLAKKFAGTAALKGASLTLLKGSVLALVGENGAGKSTLIKIVSGAMKADTGSILINKQRVDFNSPSDATSRGIATVYQELSLFPDLNVAENLVIGAYPKRYGFINWSKAKREGATFFESLGLSLPVDVPVRELGLAERLDTTQRF